MSLILLNNLIHRLIKIQFSNLILVMYLDTKKFNQYEKNYYGFSNLNYYSKLYLFSIYG